MAERKKFEKDELIKTLSEISANLPSKITIYLIGGLAMIFHGYKTVTKDVDIILDSETALKAFLSASKKAGLKGVKNLTNEYQDLGTQIILESENGARLDVFYKRVCNGLVISPDMKNRAKKMYEFQNLEIKAMSVEDIFLFKSITLRDDDLADMATLAAAELDWNLIELEAKKQPESKKWLPRLYKRLVDLEDDYGVKSPLR
jgi:hypothetical protein